jgi:hypothetical protein
MQAIRNMEPAWEKVTGLKFQLCEKSYLLADGVTIRDAIGRKPQGTGFHDSMQNHGTSPHGS